MSTKEQGLGQHSGDLEPFVDLKTGAVLPGGRSRKIPPEERELAPNWFRNQAEKWGCDTPPGQINLRLYEIAKSVKDQLTARQAAERTPVDWLKERLKGWTKEA